MATFIMKTSGLDHLIERCNPVRVMGEIESAVEDSVKHGADSMRNYIETRGTGKTWAHAWGPRNRTASTPGRVDSGEMLEGVKGGVTGRTPESVTAMLGWDKGSPDWASLQEAGFRHVLTGDTVKGMRALADAEIDTRVELHIGLQRVGKGL